MQLAAFAGDVARVDERVREIVARRDGQKETPLEQKLKRTAAFFASATAARATAARPGGGMGGAPAATLGRRGQPDKQTEGKAGAEQTEETAGSPVGYRGQAEGQADSASPAVSTTDWTLVDRQQWWKWQHPEKLLLVRVGDFYEACGVDAVMLVEHAGLNPMGGKCRAGCPVVNVQATLTDLTAAGLTVAVYEESGKTGTGKLTKTRELLQVGETATVCDRWCNRMWWMVQLYVMEAATVCRWSRRPRRLTCTTSRYLRKRSTTASRRPSRRWAARRAASLCCRSTSDGVVAATIWELHCNRM